MNISLPDEMEKLVKEKVDSGKYQTASEVVREGLRLLIERDELYQAYLAKLNQDIQVGLGQMHRGETVSLEEIHAKLQDKGNRLGS